MEVRCYLKMYSCDKKASIDDDEGIRLYRRLDESDRLKARTYIEGLSASDKYKQNAGKNLKLYRGCNLTNREEEDIYDIWGKHETQKD